MSTADPLISDEPSSVSSTLLGQLRQQDADAWKRLCHLYGPVVYGWCRRAGIDEHGAADVMQEVFQSVAGAIGTFRRDRAGDSFCAWLATITRNKIHDHFRRYAKWPRATGGTDFFEQLQNLAAPLTDEQRSISASANAAVLRRALELIRGDFGANTWRAFWQTTVEGRAAIDVAADLGLSLSGVYKAKTRVLNRLRTDLSGLLDT